jgi:hypothetical protein
VFKNKPVSTTSAQLGIRFDTGFVLSRPVDYLTNKTIKHHQADFIHFNQATFWQWITDNPADCHRRPALDRVLPGRARPDEHNGKHILPRHPHCRRNGRGCAGRHTDTGSGEKEYWAMSSFVKYRLHGD